MNLKLPVNLAVNYKSLSQIARVVTEAWVISTISCPNCGGRLKEYSSNTKSKDVFCGSCKEDFQIKSSKTKFRRIITGAEYKTTLKDVQSGQNPSLMLLHCSVKEMSVVDLEIIHRSYINENCIIPRKPLGINARRAGWQGCMFNLEKIPRMARVFLIKNEEISESSKIRDKWRESNIIKNYGSEKQGWISDVLTIVEKQSSYFTLQQIYAEEAVLSKFHPDNNNIKAKIRQQLQIIRDMGFIIFEERGQYRKRENLENV